ncbi:MAG: WYL domain-containing protein [Ruminococcus sp.]|nr:WYL domain-containing protein [Ruminococcus sp.]
MNLFSELYGTYFRITAEILEHSRITAKKIQDIVISKGFRDTVLFLPQKLIPNSSSSDWGLLRKTAAGVFSPVTNNSPVHLITGLQKRWLKSKLSDPKMKLFLTDKTAAELEARLRDVKPLYSPAFFRYTDRFSDGDNYSDPEYRRRFRVILEAVKSREVVDIEFRSSHGKLIRGRYLPLKLEFSPKNDKFRVYCRSIRKGRLSTGSIVNLGRITRLRTTGSHFAGELPIEGYFSRRRAPEPVEVMVSEERNAVERFLMEFSSYEKRTELDLENGGCRVKIWYDGADETELLIKLLSFGPVIEIAGPPDFRQKAAERVEKQYRLLNKNISGR